MRGSVLLVEPIVAHFSFELESTQSVSDSEGESP